MGLFGTLQNFFIKQRIASVISDIFRRQQRLNGFIDGDCASIAYDIVNSAWATIPDLFDGKFGKRPHDFAIAAYALGLKLENTDHNLKDQRVLIFALALNTILEEVRVNGRLYNFQSSDLVLFEQAIDSFIETGRQFDIKYPTQKS